MERKSWRRAAAVILFHAAIVFMSGILPALKPEENSLSAFYNNPDKALNTCTLQWNLNTIRGKWDLGMSEAPIFFPCARAKFFSEHLFAHMTFALPLSWFVDSPRTIYSLTYQLNRLAIGIGTSLLCLEVGAAFIPALIAGGVLIISWKLGQLQNTGLCWAILAILFFVRQLNTPRWRNVWPFVIFLTLTGLSSGYLAFYAPVALLVLCIVWMISHRRIPSRLWIAQMTVAFLFTGALLAPPMLNYKKVQEEYGLVRQQYGSAQMVLPLQSSDEVQDGREQIGFTWTGCAEILVAVAGIVLLSLRRMDFQKWEWSFYILAILSFWMAFFDASPYALIARLPGFNGLRAVYRWYFLWIAALAVIVSMVLTVATRTEKPWMKWISALALILVLFSAVPWKQTQKPIERLPESRVYSFLATQPPGPIFIFPVLPRGKLIFEVANSARMLYQLSFSFPMVSGYSGFVPKSIRLMERKAVAEGASEEFITKLSRTGVRYIVLDHLLADTSGVAAQLRSCGKCKVLYDQDGEMIVEIQAASHHKDTKITERYDVGL